LHTQSKFKLLVVRLGAMGDILHALPAVTALRHAHPGWLIDWAVEPSWRPLLSARSNSNEIGQDALQPIVDSLHLAPTKTWRNHSLRASTIREISSLRQNLRSRGYDAILDLQGAIRSAVLGRLTGCPRRIGEWEPREHAARFLFTECIVTHGAHVIEQDLELATAVAGDILEASRPQLPVDPEAELWCDELLPRHANQPVVLMNPGAGWGAKRWPSDRYAIVAADLAHQGYRVLINAGPGEESLAHDIREQSHDAATVVTSSLSQLIALTRRVSLVIAGDTGPLHLACALGRPVVGIYGPTDPSRNGPFGTRSRVLRSPDSRRDHTRRTETEAGLLTISPQDVLQAAGELLAEETLA